MDKATRVEDVKMHLALNSVAVKRHKKALKRLGIFFEDIKDGDTCKVNYTFYIEYLGSVAKDLADMSQICNDPTVIVDASCERLEKGQILVYEILKKLDSIIGTIKRRKDDTR